MLIPMIKAAEAAKQQRLSKYGGGGQWTTKDSSRAIKRNKIREERKQVYKKKKLNIWPMISIKSRERGEKP